MGWLRVGGWSLVAVCWLSLAVWWLLVLARCGCVVGCCSLPRWPLSVGCCELIVVCWLLVRRLSPRRCRSVLIVALGCFAVVCLCVCLCVCVFVCCVIVVFCVLPCPCLYWYCLLVCLFVCVGSHCCCRCCVALVVIVGTPLLVAVDVAADVGLC